jgi:hypothetical protein
MKPPYLLRELIAFVCAIGSASIIAAPPPDVQNRPPVGAANAVPLNSTYEEAWAVFPAMLKEVVELPR